MRFCGRSFRVGLSDNLVWIEFQSNEGHYNRGRNITKSLDASGGSASGNELGAAAGALMRAAASTQPFTVTYMNQMPVSHSSVADRAKLANVVAGRSKEPE